MIMRIMIKTTTTTMMLLLLLLLMMLMALKGTVMPLFVCLVRVFCLFLLFACLCLFRLLVCLIIILSAERRVCNTHALAGMEQYVR